jgi:thiol-disulfide isomerase/thioredoxin
MQGENVTFSVQSKQASLNPKPPLVGLKKNADLKTHNPEYARTAKGYSPNSQALAALKKETKPVVVRIFFGSWCPHCRQHVPFILRLEDELKATNPKIKFEYVGLPRSMDTPEAKKFNIREVPTGLVFIGGKEVGRIRRDDWNAPEVQLSKLVKGGGVAPAKNK